MLVTDDHFEAALKAQKGLPDAAQKAAHEVSETAQNAAQQASASDRTQSQKSKENKGRNAFPLETLKKLSGEDRIRGRPKER